MVVIIQYNAGNTKSVGNALERLGVDFMISDDPEAIQSADKVIFPGVGEASTAMRYLKERHLDSVIKELKQPVLGICLGLQLMCSFSEENQTECLGIFQEKVLLFPPKELVPHMGWNTVKSMKINTLLLPDEQDDYYFVHSYFAEVGQDTTAICDYIIPFSAMMQKNNFYAMQFHVEKSGKVGEKLLKRFLDLK